MWGGTEAMLNALQLSLATWRTWPAKVGLMSSLHTILGRGRVVLDCTPCPTQCVQVALASGRVGSIHEQFVVQQLTVSGSSVVQKQQYVA